MNKAILALAVISLFSGSAFAAGDSCGTIMCLGGKLDDGEGGQECMMHIKSYFDIEKKKNGHFSPEKTFKARKKYLDKCESENELTKSRIQAQWGMVKGNPF